MTRNQLSTRFPEERTDRLPLLAQQIDDDGYLPNGVTSAYMMRQSGEAVLGPVASGKDTLLAMVQDDPRIERIYSDTSRPERPSEADGKDFNRRFDIMNDFDFGELLYRLRAGDFAQATTHPKTGEFYGTDLSEYRRARTHLAVPVMSLLASEFDALQRKRRFKELGGTMVVVDDFVDYLDNRWSKREEPTRERAEEAFLCLCIGLGYSGMRFVVNDDKDKAAERLRKALTSSYSEQESAQGRIAAENMLRGFVISGLFEVSAARERFVSEYGRGGRYRLPEAAL
jgi:guanylate kinase